MREIVLDTETTGLDPATGHRVVEIGCVELFNHIPTGSEYHVYIDPQRDMPAEAYAVHGLSEEFLRGQPRFENVAEAFLGFIEEAPLVIHNAEFDLRFLNAELVRLEHAAINTARAIDTLMIARQKFPGAQASLDALCKRFEIDLSERTKHGALLDAHLLAAVYLELVGGRQAELGLAGRQTTLETREVETREYRPARTDLPGVQPTELELTAHDAFLEKLKTPIWKQE